MFNKESVLNKTLNETSTMWSIFTGFFGSFTVGEWCLIITAIITVFNFIKNWYIDMRKLKMLEEEHNAKLKIKDFDSENHDN